MDIQYLKKTLAVILLIAFFVQNLSFPIYSYTHNDNQNNKVALSSIFDEDADVVEVLMSETVQDIVNSYHKGIINETVINNILSHFQRKAQQLDKQNSFLKMQAGLMFRVHYIKLGKITEIKILIPGKNATPVKIVTNKGAYVFKPINQIDEGVNFKGILTVKPSKYFVDFMKYLADRGIPVANFIQKDDKSYSIHFGNVNYMCMEFKEGISFMDGYSPFNIDTLFAQPYNKKMGELAARIHNAQKGFEKEHPEYLSDPSLGDVEKIKLIKSFDPVVKAEIFNQKLKKKKAYLKFSHLIKEQCKIFLENYSALNKENFRRGFIHSDINPGNVRFDGDKKVSGVFDFDFSHYDYRIAEIFNLIMCYKAPLTKFKDIITAYQSNLDEPLNEDEIRGIIEYIRFKHITSPSPAYSSALKKFAADFSSEKQISEFVDTQLSSPKSFRLISSVLDRDSYSSFMKKFYPFYFSKTQLNQINIAPLYFETNEENNVNITLKKYFNGDSELFNAWTLKRAIRIFKQIEFWQNIQQGIYADEIETIKINGSYPAMQKQIIGIGDIHGDLHQLVISLILEGICEITGNLVFYNVKERRRATDIEIRNMTNETIKNYILIPDLILIEGIEATHIVQILGDILDGGEWTDECYFLFEDLANRAPAGLFQFSLGNHEENVICNDSNIGRLKNGYYIFARRFEIQKGLKQLIRDKKINIMNILPAQEKNDGAILATHTFIGKDFMQVVLDNLIVKDTKSNKRQQSLNLLGYIGKINEYSKLKKILKKIIESAEIVPITFTTDELQSVTDFLNDIARKAFTTKPENEINSKIIDSKITGGLFLLYKKVSEKVKSLTGLKNILWASISQLKKDSIVNIPNMHGHIGLDKKGAFLFSIEEILENYSEKLKSKGYVLKLHMDAESSYVRQKRGYSKPQYFRINKDGSVHTVFFKNPEKMPEFAQKISKFETYFNSSKSVIEFMDDKKLDEIIGAITITPFLPNNKSKVRKSGVKTKLRWNNIVERLKKKEGGLGSGNIWDHIKQTIRNVDVVINDLIKEGWIARNEKDLFAKKLRLIMLLHDIGKALDDGSKSGKEDGRVHELNSYLMARELLKNIGYSQEEIDYYTFFIKNHGVLGIFSFTWDTDFSDSRDKFISEFKNEHQIIMLRAVILCDIYTRPWISDEWNISGIKTIANCIKEIIGSKGNVNSKENLDTVMKNNRTMAKVFFGKVKRYMKKQEMDEKIIEKVQRTLYSEMYEYIDKDWLKEPKYLKKFITKFSDDKQIDDLIEKVKKINSVVEELKIKFKKILVMPQKFYDQVFYFYARFINRRKGEFKEGDIKKLRAMNSAL